jgi:hypothetical protein
MHEALLQPSQPLALSFVEFFAALIHSFENESVRPCILRNYDGFPLSNSGNDIDFLISPRELPRAMRALRSIEGTRIIGYIERPYVVMVFLEGVRRSSEIRGLEIDFDLSLSWKGLPYLSTEEVLATAIPRRAGDLNFFVPSPMHEAIISLSTSLLLFKRVKEKYFPQVQRTFASRSPAVIAALAPQLGLKSATRLVGAVVSGDRQRVLDCIWSIRASLLFRGLRRRPIRTIVAIGRHHAREFTIRYSPKTLETVSILGPDGFRNSAMIESLMPILQSSASFLEKVNRGLKMDDTPEQAGTASRRGDQGRSPGGVFAFIARAALLLFGEWRSQLRGKRTLTLRICDCSHYDLFIVPQRYQQRVPNWFTRFIGTFIPPSDVWILLEANGEGERSTSQPLILCETPKRLYHAFVEARKRYAVVDTSQPQVWATEHAYAAIVNALAQRTDRILNDRF